MRVALRTRRIIVCPLQTYVIGNSFFCNNSISLFGRDFSPLRVTPTRFVGIPVYLLSFVLRTHAERTGHDAHFTNSRIRRLATRNSVRFYSARNGFVATAVTAVTRLRFLRSFRKNKSANPRFYSFEYRQRIIYGRNEETRL